jgi:regulator of CtrA degradation
MTLEASVDPHHASVHTQCLQRIYCVMKQLSEGLQDGRFVRFSDKLLTSDSFRELFREGMALVEETAAYLDGDGRDESRHLPRTSALAYATESMRLTTRLMQIASWLLIQRAANDGEMNPQQAEQEKQKVKLNGVRSTVPADTFLTLPERLQELVGRTERLQQRVVLLESHFLSGAKDLDNPIASQLALLRTAFAISA